MIRGLVFIAFLFSPAISFSWCVAGYGSSCSGEKTILSQNREQTPSNINIYASQPQTIPYQVPQRIDGGEKRRLEAGDKSKNQGFTEYKKHFFSYTYHFSAYPHHNSQKSNETQNYSLSYEFAFNPFFSLISDYTNLKFKENGFKGDGQVRHLHFTTKLLFRIYPYESWVFKAGGGVTASETKDDQDKNDTIAEAYEVALYKIFGDESLMLGARMMINGGHEKENSTGFTAVGITGVMGF